MLGLHRPPPSRQPGTQPCILRRAAPEAISGSPAVQTAEKPAGGLAALGADGALRPETPPHGESGPLLGIVVRRPVLVSREGSRRLPTSWDSLPRHIGTSGASGAKAPRISREG